MISFCNDYSEGACKQIMGRLQSINFDQNVGYGLDDICEHAKILIQKEIEKEADIHFLVGGTQTNTIVISSILRPYEAVIAVESGHINVHETGSIEASGHKVLTAKGKDGKITPQEIEHIVHIHKDEHMVKPAMVYISNATEIGTIYSLSELEAISKVCKECNLYLFLDGARLASALTSTINDLTMKDIARLCDVFYIGGTKNGALFGEAVVICNPILNKDFRYCIKQRGGMLAKGWLLGVQFDELFKNHIFYDLAKHANEMASILQNALIDLNYPLWVKSYTNQIFVTVTQEQYEILKKHFLFEVWNEEEDGRISIRFVTSWATSKENVDCLIQMLKEIK